MEMELAIYEDCLNLIDKFAENEQQNFKSFCAQWKLMTFQHIYAVQTSVVEVIQTTKAIFHLAKRVVCAKDELGKLASKLNDDRHISRRIGGIYLMYAIYFRQPTKQYVKILVNSETWQGMIRYIESLAPCSTTDEVRYMFWNLYKADAFRFTALDYEVGLEDLVDYDGLYDIHKGNKTEEAVRVKLKQKLMSISDAEKVLPEMITLEDKYNKTKKSLVGSEKPIRGALPTTKIFHDIQDALKNIHDILDEARDECSTIPKRSQNYDERRKQLKRKAAGREQFLENDEESTVEETQCNDGKKYYGRLTVRQMITRALPEDMIDDLRNSSSDNEDNIGEQESDEQDDESEFNDVDSKLA